MLKGRWPAGGISPEGSPPLSPFLAKIAEDRREPPPVAGAAGASTTQPVNPDEALFTDETAKVEKLKPLDPRDAAWASFCQALLGSAEFRYVK